MLRLGASRLRRALSTSSIPPSRTKFLLSYDYVPGILEKRAPHRAAHVELAREEVAAGRLEQAGATGPISSEPTGAVFVFTTEDAAPVKAFVRKDPYHIHGLVPSYSIEEWTVVVGDT